MNDDILSNVLLEYSIEKDDLSELIQIVKDCIKKLNIEINDFNNLTQLDNLLNIISIIYRYRKNKNISQKDIVDEICFRFNYYMSDDEGKVFSNDIKLQYEILTLKTTTSIFSSINKPLSMNNPSFSLLNDMFQTTFDKISSFCKMFSLDLFPDGYVTWRTIHESESILYLLVNNDDNTKYSYLRHIEYSNMFYNPEMFDDEFRDNTFENEIKRKMKEHDLKSKDIKRFLDYGWLYDCKQYDMEKHPKFKLNFNDGIDELSGLRETYNEYYRGTSEITHSSSIYFYSNNSTIKNVAEALIFSSSYRIFTLYKQFMNTFFINNKNMDEITDRSLSDIRKISEKLNVVLES